MMNIKNNIAKRFELDMQQYDALVDLNRAWMFGIENKDLDLQPISHIYEHFFEGRGLLVLKGVRQYHREYCWS